jgi:hypothetical protein
VTLGMVVEVILPADAEALAYLPLEAARIQSRSHAGHDVTLEGGTREAPFRFFR